MSARPPRHPRGLVCSAAAIGFLLLLGFGLGVLAGPAVVAQESPEEQLSIVPLDPVALRAARINRVIDGSSLDAHVEGTRTALGYLGIRTPQLNQPCGREALERNRELAGTEVLLEEDATQLFDELGRRLYRVVTPSGHSIEEILVREGLAWAVRTDGHHGAILATLQAEAEAAGDGCLWHGA